MLVRDIGKTGRNGMAKKKKVRENNNNLLLNAPLLIVYVNGVTIYYCW